jgi:hypothetical protein
MALPTVPTIGLALVFLVAAVAAVAMAWQYFARKQEAKSSPKLARELPELSSSQRRAIALTVIRWAEAHPRPDTPIVQLVDNTELTPQDMARALVDEASSRGQLLYRVFAAGLIKDSVEEPEALEEILSDFERDIERWSAANRER